MAEGRPQRQLRNKVDARKPGYVTEERGRAYGEPAPAEPRRARPVERDSEPDQVEGFRGTACFLRCVLEVDAHPRLRGLTFSNAVEDPLNVVVGDDLEGSLRPSAQIEVGKEISQKDGARFTPQPRR